MTASSSSIEDIGLFLFGIMFSFRLLTSSEDGEFCFAERINIIVANHRIFFVNNYYNYLRVCDMISGLDSGRKLEYKISLVNI